MLQFEEGSVAVKFSLNSRQYHVPNLCCGNLEDAGDWQGWLIRRQVIIRYGVRINH